MRQRTLMYRSGLSILALLPFLMLTIGISENLHILANHKDHHADTEHCQLCYLMAVSSVAVPVTLPPLPAFQDCVVSHIPIFEQHNLGVERPGDTSPRGPPIR